MGFEVTGVAFGHPAADLLAKQVAEAKRGEPLAAVTVVVPTNYVGVAMRRELARRGDGIAAVSFTTLHRLGELLGGPRLAAAGRRPISAPVIAAAIRSVLADHPGVFAPVAEHPATEEALTASYRELSDVSGPALDALASQSDRAADVVRIFRTARAQLAAEWHDEHDLLVAAAEALNDGARAAASPGPVIVHLPQQISLAGARLLECLAAEQTVLVNVGLTGHQRADASIADDLKRLGIALPDTGLEPPVADRIVSVSDPDEEVRATVRMLVDAMRVGIPLARMAVVYGSTEPYAQLLHEQLAAAGIPRNGVPVHTIGEGVLGRTLRSLLELPGLNFRRRDVLGLVASNPVRDPDTHKRVHSRAWERVSRKAGIVDGNDWGARLPALAIELRAKADTLEADGELGRADGNRREAGDAEALATFVATLHDDLAKGETADGWAAMAEWATNLIERYLGDDRRRIRWPEAEQKAAEKVEAALDRLASLDALAGPAPTLDVFVRTLDAELEVALPRVGKLGDGVLVGHVSSVTGLVLDRVFVLGMAEGAFPPRRLEDSLLPDREREVTNGELPLRSARIHEDHRRFLAAVAAADQAVLCFPRGDLRRSGDRTASRWLLADATALAGRTVFTGDLASLKDEPWFEEIPSFNAGLARLTFPATSQEYGVRALLAREGDLADQPEVKEDPILAAGVELTSARRSSNFTRFDGNLADVGVPSPADDDRPRSATSLEKWGTCPHRYLLEQLLRVDVVEDPEREVEMSALDKGSLVHEILEAFIKEALETGVPISAWTDDDRRRLLEIAEEHCKDAEAKGVTGRPIFWHRDKPRIIADLERFLRDDTSRRAANNAQPMAAEMEFSAVNLPLNDGRHIVFRGYADRVDRTGDGDLIVIDYKTGSISSYKDLGPEDPDQKGTRLQLPVYGAAARAAHGDDDTTVHAAYWFVSAKGDFKWIGYDLTPEIDVRIADVLATVADGIGAGVFPARPNPIPPYGWVDCHYCDPDGLGTADLRRAWDRKKSDPALAAYVALAEPAEDGNR